jgi:transposase
MMTPTPPLAVTTEQRAVLTAWVRAGSTSQAVVQRARICLLAADGKPTSHIAEELGVARDTVMLWRRRFENGGPEALTKIAKGRGRKPVIPEEKIDQIVEATLHTTPPGATHWSLRSMARAQEVCPHTVWRVWRAHNLQPHRVRTFKLSNDPRFVEKLTDVVGLYLNPPDKAVVLCVDEKSQVQALDRTQPGLPMKPGRCGTMTHDYKRNGTTTLFAALNTLDGRVVGECHPRHRHQEFIRFLRRLDEEFPGDFELHLILDNYGTHKHPKVKTWLAKHPRFQLHFTPTSSSWLNLVERWFRELTDKAIRRGVFVSVPDLCGAILEYLDAHNADPRPFVWTASIERIIEKISKCRAILQPVH